MDFSQLLVEKIDTITNNWVEAVRADSQIESADDLPHTAIEDHLPFILRAIATVIDSDQKSDIQSIVQNSWTHGTVRADQGYTPAEVAREYHLLRSVLFSVVLQKSLLSWYSIVCWRIQEYLMNAKFPFRWRHYQPEIILLGVRWYLRYPLSYRNLEEMMSERGLGVDHTTVYR